MSIRHVLFLCTGNSARSILGEATLNHLGRGRFVGHSAGSKPAGRVNPAALRELARSGIATEGLRSKSWDEFSAPGAAKLDIVITVCDNAANESCPVFFGDFVRAHWGLPDPAAVEGGEALVDEAFRRTHAVIGARLQALLALPLDALDATALATELDAIDARIPAVPLVDAAR